jgi:hypothetical protein
LRRLHDQPQRRCTRRRRRKPPVSSAMSCLRCASALEERAALHGAEETDKANRGRGGDPACARCRGGGTRRRRERVGNHQQPRRGAGVLRRVAARLRRRINKG